jgi:hypothetical protein
VTTSHFSIDDIKQAIIQTGYEISDCNDDGWTDFDEAIRIFCEREPQHEAVAMANISEIEVGFRHEFPQGKAR